MLNIFILEDSLHHQSRLEAVIDHFVKERHLKYRRLDIFGKPHQLMAAITETGNHQLFFLDIEIKGEEQKGMEIAREIRQKDPAAIIVFVTTHSEFMPVTYKYRVSALDFIDKGLSDQDFALAVEDILTYAFDNVDQAVSDDAFSYQTQHSRIQVPFKDILYFETSPTVHKVILHSKTGQTEFYGKVSEIAKVDERLYQSHRAYVVNPENIIKIDKKSYSVYFEDDEECLVSRGKWKGLVERLEDR